MIQALATTGTLLGLFGAGSLLLQARRLLLLGTACEISLPIRVLTLTGYTVWLAYGLAIGNLPLILVDAAGLLAAIVVIRVTVRLRRRRPCPATYPVLLGATGAIRGGTCGSPTNL
jgi:uncharacterized protein with PQ loop repeat